MFWKSTWHLMPCSSTCAKPQGGAGPSLRFPVGCTSGENLSLAGAASHKNCNSLEETMILLIPLNGEKKLSRDGERTSIGWKHHLRSRLLNWLTEPIPFPGKWPVNAQSTGKVQ